MLPNHQRRSDYLALVQWVEGIRAPAPKHRWMLVCLKLQQKYHMTRGCPYGTLGSEVSADDELAMYTRQVGGAFTPGTAYSSRHGYSGDD